MSEHDSSGQTPAEEGTFSQAVTELNDAEKLAQQRIEHANLKKQKIVALARQKAQEILEASRKEALAAKNKVVARAQEENLAKAKHIVEQAEKEGQRIKAKAKQRIPACNKKLYGILFEQ